MVIGYVLSNGVGLNRFEVQFAANATVSHVQGLLRAIDFSTVGASSADNQVRTIQTYVKDPLGASTSQVAREVRLIA